MAICIVEPGLLEGRLLVPPSKSMGHRALFCAALAEGESHIDNIVLSDDISATLAALNALGVISVTNPSKRFPGRTRITVHGTGHLKPTGKDIDCHESGSTARFVIPVSRLVSDTVTVTGSGGLMERPFGLFRDLFHGKGVSISDRDGHLPFMLQGRLEPGVFHLRGDVSSQFITGLLFILPLLQADSVIDIEGTLESAPYVAMTIEMLALFGVHAQMENGLRILVPGRQHFRPMDHDVEGDWSQAAFWVVAGALGSPLVLDGLRLDSLQGDRVVVDILRSMGADIRQEGSSLHVGGIKSPVQTALPSTTGIPSQSLGISGTMSTLHAVNMDVAQCPDLVPALTVAAVYAKGSSSIFNAARLRIKESDRLQAMREQLGALGASIREEPDGLVITGRCEAGTDSGTDSVHPDNAGTGRLSGGFVQGCGDHRIVMASAIAATCADGGVTIDGMEAVRKSYPDFWDDFRQLGGRVHEQYLG